MNYWQNFYKNKKLHKKIDFPSQFAIFCTGERLDERSIIEFGCGNGRDALFFSKYFKKVYAFDKSKFAIDYNKKSFLKNKNLSFYKYDINDKFRLIKLRNEKKSIYARFFLHTLNNHEIILFTKLCSSLLKKNEKVFCEYRTKKDKSKKNFKKSFQKLLNPYLKIFKSQKLNKIYQVEGQVFKYKSETLMLLVKYLLKNDF